MVPYVGVFAYLITQGGGMTERNIRQSQQAREDLRRVVGFSIADEIEKLDRIKNRDRSPLRSSRVFALSSFNRQWSLFPRLSRRPP